MDRRELSDQYPRRRQDAHEQLVTHIELSGRIPGPYDLLDRFGGALGLTLQIDARLKLVNLLLMLLFEQVELLLLKL